MTYHNRTSTFNPQKSSHRRKKKI
uniref:Uncharacterized protein n=1 Tax=Rhizophora mucronata TaxID=61149 RepID=A0A2P2PXF0_RHIMU